MTSLPIPSPGITAIRIRSKPRLGCSWWLALRVLTLPIWKSSNAAWLHKLYRHRHPHPTAHAQRRKPASETSALELVQQCHNDARAGTANWMTEGNRAAIDVDLLARNLDIAQDREHL